MSTTSGQDLTTRLRACAGKLARKVAEAPLATALAISVIAATFYVIAYPFTVVRYPPITDLPFHGAAVSIFRHYLDPSWHFRQQFDLQLLQLPYWTHYMLGALLAFFMPVVAATKVSTVVLLSMLPAGLAVMFHGMRKSPLLGVLALPLVWNTLALWGFISFLAAVGLFCMAVGLTLMVVDRPTRGRQVALAVVLVLVYASHIFRFPFALAAVVGTTLVMYPATRRWKPVLPALVPALVALGVWLVVRPKGMATEPSEPWKVHWDRVAMIPGYLFNGFTGPEEKQLSTRSLWILGAVAVACLVGWLAERRWRSWSRQDRWFVVGSHLAVLSCTLVFLAMYLVLPMQIGTWWYVYPREITIVSLVVLGLTPDLPRLSVLRAPLLAAVIWGAGSHAFFVSKSFARFDAETEDFARIIEQIPRAPKLGYMVFDHSGSNRSTTPFIHLPAWVQALRGGTLSFHFVGFGTHPFKYHEGSPDVPPPFPVRFEWTPERFDIATRGRFFDWFLVRSPGSPESRFRVDPTIKLVDHQGSWWLFKREGAPVQH